MLAGIGLYGVIAYGVAQRRQEIGVRIALGARSTHIARLVLGGGLRLATTGVVLGSLVAFVAGRWVTGLLFQESPSDPVIYVLVAATLIVVSLFATAVPAIGASRLDPNVTLRAE
jgi:ABC-type antimicrobial peptide transport system permease subunit